MEMPENAPGGRIKGNQISKRITAEEKFSGGGKDAGNVAAFGKLVRPANLASFSIERFKNRMRPQILALTGVALRSCVRIS